MRLRYLLLLVAVALVACADRKEAESYLGGYIEKFYPGAVVIASECQNKDSDDDGYVSCTVRLKEPEPCEDAPRRPTKWGEPKVVSVECAASWPWQVGRWLQDGCRTPKIHGGI